MAGINDVLLEMFKVANAQRYPSPGDICYAQANVID
jgi:hypothetical protein